MQMDFPHPAITFVVRGQSATSSSWLHITSSSIVSLAASSCIGALLHGQTTTDYVSVASTHEFARPPARAVASLPTKVTDAFATQQLASLDEEPLHDEMGIGAVL
jgi:hypothetical protein